MSRTVFEGMEKQGRPINWKLFSVLLGASILSTVAVLPYSLTLQADLLKEVPVSLFVIVLASLIQTVVLFTIFIIIGLYLSKRIGFGSPILEGWLKGKDVRDYTKSILGISILLGLLVGIAIIGLDFLFHAFGTEITIAKVVPPLWQGFLACFYGGIAEEIIMRLFLMTFLVWISSKIKKVDEGMPSGIGVWLAIILSAVLFGVGHLPITTTLEVGWI